MRKVNRAIRNQRLTAIGCVAQWWNAGLSPANLHCPALNLQLTRLRPTGTNSHWNEIPSEQIPSRTNCCNYKKTL